MGVRPILTGLFSYVPGAYRHFTRGPNLTTPEHSYGIAFKHLCLMSVHGASFPVSLAEVGPGRSVGAGILSLLLGAQRYIGLDVVPFARLQNEADAWVDGTVSLLRRRAALPNADGFPVLRPYLDSDGFPLLVSDRMLATALDPARIAAVRACLKALRVNRPGRADGLTLEYRVPWESSVTDLRGSIDAVFSHAVMQHVPDPGGAYRRIADLLRPGCFTSHQIDYGSLGVFRVWNGHWAYPDWLWRLVLGRKPFLTNRLSHGGHVKRLEAAGLELRASQTWVRKDGLPVQKLATRFRDLGDDAQIAGAVLIARRPTSNK